MVPHVGAVDKPLVWLARQVKSPPFSASARIEAGFLLRQLQQGRILGLPHSRPMPSIGKACHEPRIQDERQTWRIVYRIDPDAIVVLDVFSKKTASTPSRVIEACQQRLKHYDRVSRDRP